MAQGGWIFQQKEHHGGRKSMMRVPRLLSWLSNWLSILADSDLRVLWSSSALGSVLSGGSAWRSFPSAPTLAYKLSLAHSVSLSQINKYIFFLKKTESERDVLGNLNSFCRLRWWLYSRYPEETRPECRTNTSSEKAYYDKLRIAKGSYIFEREIPWRVSSWWMKIRCIVKRSFQCECGGQTGSPFQRSGALSHLLGSASQASRLWFHLQ